MNIKTTMLEKLELWGHFKEKAAIDGFSTNDALVRLIQRYLAKGFDDGALERAGARTSGQRVSN